MSFLTPLFATAGLILAAGPVIIHLLNRRRFRVVDWAAMDFLKEAMQRQRRILRLRDLFLLVLRTLCILFFGLAMARPKSDGGVVDADNPVHAILVIDNSLSMSYGGEGDTVLDKAKIAARELVKSLPLGSRYSVLPLCSSDSSEFTMDAHATREDAQSAIDKITILDRTAGVPEVLTLAKAAVKNAVEDKVLLSRHLVFFGDQQANNWPRGGAISGLLKSIGRDDESDPYQVTKINVVQVGEVAKGNVWIEDLRVQDEVADVESRTVFIVKLRYEAAEGDERTIENIDVRLEIDGAPPAQKTIDLVPGQVREVAFSHKFDPFDPDLEEGGTKYATVKASTSVVDDLKLDNERYLVVPVLSAIPVVFIDQYGTDEAPASNKYGETYHVRNLLAPTLSNQGDERQLIKKVHVRIDEVGREHLSDARMVVIAGVDNPEEAIDDLREYVEQGGQVFIAAGGDFDQKLWQDHGWGDKGEGILPAPLREEVVGKLPGKGVKDIEPFQIQFDSLSTRRFQVERESDTALEDLYMTPIFFKAVIADVGDEDSSWETTKKSFLAAEIKRISEERAAGEDRQEKVGRWLKWSRDIRHSDSTAEPETLAESLLPVVTARYDNGHPMFVERRIGAGQVVFFTSGLSSDWNTLTRTNAVLVLDRILRGMLNSTLQKANFTSAEEVRIGIRARDKVNSFSLTRPGEAGAESSKKSIDVQAVAGGGNKIEVEGVRRRGHYIVESSGKTNWRRPLAVNGPVSDSELAIAKSGKINLPEEESYKLGWSNRLDAESLEGGIAGQDSWKLWMSAVLLLLLIEILILSWGALSSTLTSASAADSEGSPATEGA